MSRVVAVALAAALAGGCAVLAEDTAPPRAPALVAPEIIVSLEGLTVHLFDRTTGASFVFAARPGGIGKFGRSVTPIGHFTTGPDARDSWWYNPRRTQPAVFAGMPFVRLTAMNYRGQQVYGFHGPTEGDDGELDYVSKGCVRLAEDDIRRLFAILRAHPSAPVTIQQEIELDAAGRPVRVGETPALWPPGAAIRYGESVGPRP